MKKIFGYLVLLTILIALAATTGCDIVTGSGEIATWQMDYADFSRLEIGSAFEVEITRSESYSVNITIDKSLYEYLSIAQRGDTLHIGLKPNHTYTATTQKAVINLPDLRRLELSGASKAVVSGFSTSHSVDIELSGASRLDLNPMKAGNTSFVLSGSSKVDGSIEMADGKFDLSGDSILELKGLANDIDVDASGASNVLLSELPAANAEVELSGASHAVINTSTRIDVNLSGVSVLEYIGSPKLGSISISGGSMLNQK